MERKLTSEELYHHMRSETQSKQKLASLAILWGVLLEQRERRSDNYSVALIARLTAARNGLKESSIRNKAGEAYRQLIQTFSAEAAEGKTRRPAKAGGTWQDELLGGIEDLATRARVGVILSENRKLKTELDLIKSAIQREYMVPEHQLANRKASEDPVPPMKVIADELSEAGHPDMEIIPPPVRLLPQEVRALEHFISKENLDANGWVITDAGALKRNGQTVARPGFVPGLRKGLSGLR